MQHQIYLIPLPSWLRLQNTQTASRQRDKTQPSMNALDMTLNNLMVIWGMQSTPSIPLLPGLLWPRVVALDRVQSMGQIELNCVIMLN